MCEPACCCKKKVVFHLAEQVDGMNPTFEEKALSRIQKTGGGWAFSPRDFLDIGGRPTVDSGLHRLEKRGEIRRVIRGIYDYPSFSKFLDQTLSPDIDQVARALARKFRWRIQPSGATALNFLGLSTQADAVATIPTHRPKNNPAFKMTPLELCHDQLRFTLSPSSSGHQIFATEHARLLAPSA
jgi:hypothetical protein